MAGTKGSQEQARRIGDARRAAIVPLILRSMPMRQIVIRLAEDGVIKPDGGRWTLSTVNKDIQRITEAWHREMLEGADKRFTVVLNELREVRRSAWEQDPPDYNAILRSIKQETDLLGLGAPAKLDAFDRALKLAEQLGIPPDELIGELRAIDVEWRTKPTE